MCLPASVLPITPHELIFSLSKDDLKCIFYNVPNPDARAFCLYRMLHTHPTAPSFCFILTAANTYRWRNCPCAIVPLGGMLRECGTKLQPVPAFWMRRKGKRRHLAHPSPAVSRTSVTNRVSDNLCPLSSSRSSLFHSCHRDSFKDTKYLTMFSSYGHNQNCAISPQIFKSFLQVPWTFTPKPHFPSQLLIKIVF